MSVTQEIGLSLVFGDQNATKTITRLNQEASSLGKGFAGAAEKGGYLEYSLKRIATYSAIFAAFGTLIKLMDEVAETELRLAEVATLVDRNNQMMLDSFDQVKKELLSMSGYFGTSTELAKGLYEIMSAGVEDPVEALNLLKTSAMYAKVGLTDLQTSASMLTSVMKAYGFSAETMKQKTDVLFQSVAVGKYHAEELNGAIGNVLPTAAAMGVKIEEIAAALAFMSNRGLSASESATALNRFLLTLLRPIGKAEVGLRQLGIEFGINAFKTKSFTEVLQTLVEKSKQFGDLIPKIFRRETGLKFMYAAQGDIEGFNNALERISSTGENAGVVVANFGKINKTVKQEVAAMWAELVKAANGFMNQVSIVNALIQMVKYLGVTVIESIPVIIGFAGAWKVFHGLIGLTERAVSSVATALTVLSEQVRAGIITSAQYATEFGTLYKKMEAAARMAQIFRFTVVALNIAMGVYLALRTALDAWTKAIDRNIERQETANKVYAETYAKLKDVKRVYEEMTMGTIKSTDLYFATERKVLEELEKVMGSVQTIHAAMNRPLAKQVGQKLGLVDRKDIDALNELLIYLKKVPAGQRDLFQFNDIIKRIGMTSGLTAAAMTELIEKMKMDSSVSNYFSTIDKDAANFARTIKAMQTSISSVAEDLVGQLSKDELKNMLDSLNQLSDPSFWKSDLGKALAETYRDSVTWIQANTKQLSLLKAETEKALGMYDETKYAQKVEEFYSKYKEALSGLSMKQEDARASAEALFAAYKDALKEGVSAKAFFNIDEVQKAFEQLYAQIQKVPEHLRAFIVEGYKATHKEAKTALEKMAEDLAKLSEGNIERQQEINKKMEELDNKFYNQKRKNAVVAAKDLADEMRKKYDEELELAIETNKNVEDAIKLRINREEELFAYIVKAKRDYLLESKKEEIKTYAELIGNNKKMAASYIANARTIEAAFVRSLFEMGLSLEAIDEIMEPFRAAWEKLRKEIEKDEKAKPTQIEKWKALHMVFNSVNTIMKDLQSNMGSMGKTMEAIVNIVDAVAKGIGGFAEGLESLKLAKTQQGFEAFASTAAGALAIVGAATNLFAALTTELNGTISAEALHEQALIRQKKALEDLNATGKDAIKIMQGLDVIGAVLAAKYGSVSAAISNSSRSVKNLIKNFSDMLEKFGVSSGNYLDYINALNVVLDAYKNGALDAGEAAKGLGAMFKDLIDAARNVGVEGSKAMADFIAKVRESGLYIKEIVDYVDKQLGVKRISMSGAEGAELLAKRGLQGYQDKLEEIADAEKQYKDVSEELLEARKDLSEWLSENAEKFGSDEYWKKRQELEENVRNLYEKSLTVWQLLKKLGKEASDISQDFLADIKNVETQVLGLFNAMVENGASYYEALDSLGPALDALLEKYKALGLEASPAIQELLKIRGVVNANKDLFDAINGNLAVLQALANTGSLTQETFQAAAYNMLDYFARLKNAGLSEQQALQVIKPTLQQLYNLQRDYGYVLDEQTQALIEQGIANGTIKRETLSMTDALLGGFGLLLQTMGVSLPKAMRDAIDKMKEMEKTTPTTPSSEMLTLRDNTKEAGDKMDFLQSLITDAPRVWDIFGSAADRVLSEVERQVSVVLGLVRDLNKELAGTGSGLPASSASVASDITNATYRRQTSSSSSNEGVAEVNISLDGERVYKGMVSYIRKGASYADFESSGEGVF